MFITSNPFIRLLSICIGIVFITFAYHHSALNGTWRWDDPVMLQDVMQNNFWDYFIKPSSWSSEQLTPWLWFSFDVDYSLFGLETKWFYIHHLFSISLIGIFTFVLLNKWVSSLWAFLGSILFIISPAVIVVSQQLMTRQYVEGLFFSILAILFFIRSLETKNFKLLWLAMLFYLLACSAKEFYVPIVFFFIIFSYKNQSKFNLKYVLPPIFIFILYLVWRHHMVLNKVSSYWDFMRNAGINVIADKIYQIPFFSFGEVGGYLLLTIAVIFITYILRNYQIQHRNLMLFLTIIFALLLPSLASLIGIGEDFNLRYVFAFSWVTTVFFILIINQFFNTIIRVILYGMFITSIVVRGIDVKNTLEPTIREVDQTIKFLLQQDKDKKFFLDDSRENTPWYTFLYRFHSLEYIKKFQGSSLPEILAQLPVDNNTLSTIYTYQKDCNCVKALEKEKYEQWKKKIMEKPLSVQITTKDNVINWKLAPYNTGTYYAITKNSKLALNKEGSLTIAPSKINIPINFYIQYISPEGWITHSPSFNLQPNSLSNGTISWERN